MATAFRTSDPGVTASFDEAERDLLTRLFLDVAEMLEQGLPDDADPLVSLVGITPEAHVPEDPALARLLPPGTTGDDELAGEFRRFTEMGLRERKSAALRRAAASLATVRPPERVRRKAAEKAGRLELDREAAGAWVTALTDVRLVLAERLGIRTDEDAEELHDLAESEDEEDPRAWLAAVYDFLTWLQETLVTALSAGLR
ncbi:MAG: DUF2017 domain-containing protein [Actinomycetes bacterium]